MNKFNLTMLSATLCLAMSGGAIAAPQTKAEYETAKAEISTKYKADKAACKLMSGNAKDICKEEAKGTKKIVSAQ